MAWTLFDHGTTIGQRGSEDGVILSDEEHESGARITLERDGTIAPFAITCGIYGWMFHTRFLGLETEARAELEAMKVGLAAILDLIPRADDPTGSERMARVSEAIASFVDRFP